METRQLYLGRRNWEAGRGIRCQLKVKVKSLRVRWSAAEAVASNFIERGVPGRLHQDVRLADEP
ncbi:hypothetical protein GRAN_0146 [Granulicella sibirica]|uniref:Uncharacterized protein n=1 Tax=Granulicella sibirica TaxID=2479048 RepID=A0A4Q0T5E0_9BACT|nr:hypothetical protein GRAN_0146 [Granulicella sibirica]